MDEALEERISSRWQPMVRLEEMVTPRTRIGLSWRLLDAAQALMWENSSFKFTDNPMISCSDGVNGVPLDYKPNIMVY